MTGRPLPPGVQVIERGWLSANMVVAPRPLNTAVIDSGYCTHSAQTVILVRTALACPSSNGFRQMVYYLKVSTFKMMNKNPSD